MSTYKLINLLSGIMFFLMPWYYFDSGSLQPVDLIIGILIILFCLIPISRLNGITKYSKSYQYYLLLALYTLIALLLNFILDPNKSTLTLIELNVYYVVLTTLFFVLIHNIYLIYPPLQSYKMILNFLLVDLFIPLYYLLSQHTLASRISLCFNNPNQLGFFVLVNMSIFMYASLLAKKHAVQMFRLRSLVIINANILFLFLSSSRACYPTIILYIISYFLIFKFRFRGFSFWLFWILASAVAFFGVFEMSHGLFHHMETTRISMLPTDYNGLYNDIYFRALEGLSYNLSKIGYFLFGNGTYSVAIRGTLEFHNNFAAIFNQVGILGLIFYLFMTSVILWELYKIGLVYVIPYLCYMYYSMFHYSYRARANWLFLAFVFFIILHNKLSNNKYKSFKERIR